MTLPDLQDAMTSRGESFDGTVMEGTAPPGQSQRLSGYGVNATLHGAPGVALNNIVTTTFNDANPIITPSEFRAAIDWGDGAVTLGMVNNAAGGGFDVTGSHAYATAGNYTVFTTIQNAATTDKVICRAFSVQYCRFVLALLRPSAKQPFAVGLAERSRDQEDRGKNEEKRRNGGGISKKSISADQRR